MWIATNEGFLSVVKPRPFDVPEPERKRFGRGWQLGLLMVRARREAHLKTLFPGKRVYKFKARDYPCRVYVARPELGDMVGDLVAGVDYTNFKDSVRDGELHDAYMGVWSVMHRFQYGEYKRTPRGRQLPFIQTRVEGDEVNGELDEASADWFANARWQLPNDGVCGKDGCTADQPCVGCLTDALRGHNERSLGTEPDRYGDFDDDDDSGAQSHLRVPPK